MAKMYLHKGKRYEVSQTIPAQFDDFIVCVRRYPSDPEKQDILHYDTWKYSMFLYTMTIGALEPLPSPHDIPDTRDSLQRLIHTVWYGEKRLTSADLDKIDKCADAVLWQIDWRRRHGAYDENDSESSNQK